MAYQIKSVELSNQVRLPYAEQGNPSGVPLFEGLLEGDSSEKLARIKAPTLIIWGEHDTIVPLSDQEKLATRIEGSQLITYPGVGHSVYWEERVKVASDIANFIKEHLG